MISGADRSAMFKRVPQKLKHWVKKVTEAIPGPVRVKGWSAKGEKVENKEGSPTLEITSPAELNAVADQAATTVPEPPFFELPAKLKVRVLSGVENWSV